LCFSGTVWGMMPSVSGDAYAAVHPRKYRRSTSSPLDDDDDDDDIPTAAASSSLGVARPTSVILTTKTPAVQTGRRDERVVGLDVVPAYVASRLDVGLGAARQVANHERRVARRQSARQEDVCESDWQPGTRSRNT